MITYEGGQLLVGIHGGENSKKLETLFHQVNAHPKMGGTLYAILRCLERCRRGSFLYVFFGQKMVKMGKLGFDAVFR